MRTALSQEELESQSIAIANNALGCDIWNYEYYHIFLPIARLREINTEYLLSILSGKDKHILLSKSNFEEQSMAHYLLTDSTRLVENIYGIPEPLNGIEISSKKIDVVFIPLLAFDKQGNRVGYGKGFYDRFLASCKPDVMKVGLSFFEPESEIIKKDIHDINLDYCITAKEVYSF